MPGRAHIRSKVRPKRRAPAAKAMGVPAHLRERNPLITPRAAQTLREIQEHPDAPKWNYACGDRIESGDLDAIEAFRDAQFASRATRPAKKVPPEIVRRIAAQIPHVEWLRSRLGTKIDLAKNWDTLPAMTREDFSRDMGFILPDGCDLDAAYIYDTSGTTGHVLYVPNSARGVSSYLPLLEFAMARHDVRVAFSESKMGCVLVCAQSKTIAYASVHAVWNNSAYAKVNLASADWPQTDSARRFFKAFNPPVICGDPVAFVELIRQKIPIRPKAMISTALALAPAVRTRLEKHFKCPVIDTYSLNETGLISYACRKGFHHVLPHDIHVETLDEKGRQVPEGQRGEITVSGGRNPFVPLLRYRTGDWARLEPAPCACGDPFPRLLDFEGRAPVLFRSKCGDVINNVDLSRVLRKFPIVQFRFEQKKDLACTLLYRKVPGSRNDWLHAAREELGALFGGVLLHVKEDAGLGRAHTSGKVVPYKSAFTLET